MARLVLPSVSYETALCTCSRRNELLSANQFISSKSEDFLAAEFQGTFKNNRTDGAVDFNFSFLRNCLMYVFAPQQAAYRERNCTPRKLKLPAARNFKERLKTAAQMARLFLPSVSYETALSTCSRRSKLLAANQFISSKSEDFLAAEFQGTFKNNRTDGAVVFNFSFLRNCLIDVFASQQAAYREQIHQLKI